MNLKVRLYQFCKDNELEDLSCIIHFSLLNYITTHPSEAEYVNLSIKVLDYFMGIGEDQVASLLEYLSECDEIQKYYAFPCLADNRNHCDSCHPQDIDDNCIELYCHHCEEAHEFNMINDGQLISIGYEGDREKIISVLQINNQDIANELVVLNTNSDHIDKLANIIVSRLDLGSDKEEAKGRIVQMLSSVKDVSGLIAGISEDTSTTVTSLRKIAEDFTGIGTIKDLLSSPESSEE